MGNRFKHIQKLLRRRDYAFFFLLIVFAAEAVWLAVTSRYPMAFDESYHFGLIQFFSHHLNPFVSSQPPSSYPLGQIVHNPSFLYHYLLSFPYRLVAMFTGDLRLQVTAIRLISVGMAIASLIVIKRSLRLLNLPNALANAVVLVLAFTPTFTALSAQINYDNLLILGVALTVLLTAKFVRSLQSGQFNAWALSWQLVLCLWASEVKFAFLPVFVGVVVADLWFLAFLARHQGLSGLWRSAKRSYGRLAGWQLVSLAVTGTLGLSLFMGTYGVDVVEYHNPEPQCNQVLSVSACKQYYSWDRNYELAQARNTIAINTSPIAYTAHWLKASYYQLFAEMLPIATGGMVPIAPAYLDILMALTMVALVCTLANIKRIYRNHPAVLAALGVSAVYALFLWGRNYYDFRMLGAAVAVQGRYLLPVIVYLYALLALGVWYSLQREHRLISLSRAALAAELVIVFLYFGGFSSYRANISPVTQWQPEHNLTAIVAAKPKNNTN